MGRLRTCWQLGAVLYGLLLPCLVESFQPVCLFGSRQQRQSVFSPSEKSFRCVNHCTRAFGVLRSASRQSSIDDEEGWGKLPPEETSDDPLYGDLTFPERQSPKQVETQKRQAATTESASEAAGGPKVKARRRGIRNLRVESPRDTAFAVLMRRETGEASAFIEDLLEDGLARAALSPADRALCKELVLGCVRFRLLLQHLITQKQKGTRKQQPAVRVLLSLGLYQLLLLDRVPEHAAVAETVEIAKRCGFKEQSGFINAVLRAYAREQDPLQTATALHLAQSHPQWLSKEWIKRYGTERAEQLMRWNNQPAKTYARVNRIKCDPALLLSYWREEGVEFESVQVDWADSDDLYCIHPPVALRELPSFTAGLFYVQRASSMLCQVLREGRAFQDPSTLLSVDALDPQPGDAVLDLCAAPGGKTCLIGQRMANVGRVVASDVDSIRLQRVAANCERMGVTCAETVEAAALPDSTTSLYDKVLVDAPCSNSGVMRRRVDVRWRISKETIRDLHETQFCLLQEAAQRVRVGGVLVYSTCSIEPDENQNVIRRFIKRSAEGWEVDMERQASPLTDATDGAYVARLVRKQ